MAGKQQAELGAVQETLFIPLAGRARETARKHPMIRDPKAAGIVESVDFDTSKYGAGAGGLMTVLRTAIFDAWVEDFLAEHPSGSVIEMGTGLNSRFERVDNGTVHWLDLDLPDTIELRRRFYEDTGRRRMIAASVVDDSWLDQVKDMPGPYFFLTEGTLVYLREDEVRKALGQIVSRFPGARLALDTYSRKMYDRQQRMGTKRDIARWQWPCDNPAELEEIGLVLLESRSITKPPRVLRSRMSPAVRLMVWSTAPVVGKAVRLNLFRTR